MMQDPVTLDISYITFHELQNKLKDQYPEIESLTNVVYVGSTYIKVNKNEREFSEKRVLFTDSDFFKVFDFKLLLGRKGAVLTSPFSAILSQTTSKKYFGDGNAIGEIIFHKDKSYKVEGIAEDVPSNSHLQFDILLSKSSLPEPKKALEQGGFTYISLKEGNKPAELKTKLNRNSKDLLTWNNVKPLTFDLQKLNDCYFSDVQIFHSDVLVGKNKKKLIGLFMVMNIILFIASFNLINFFQAKALFRSKEISIQRILGAGRISTLLQFILESFILCFIALLVSFIVILIILPQLNLAFDITITAKSIMQPLLIGTLLITILIISLILGVITNIFYGRIHNSNLMKGTISIGSAQTKILNGLVIIQLAISIILSLVSAVIWNQMDFIRNKPLGFTKGGGY